MTTHGSPTRAQLADMIDLDDYLDDGVIPTEPPHERLPPHRPAATPAPGTHDPQEFASGVTR